MAPFSTEVAEAATSNVTPNGDVSVGSWTRSSGTSSYYTYVDEGTTSPNDADFVASPVRADGSITFDLGAMPADVEAVTGVTIKASHREGGSGNDTNALSYVVLNSSNASLTTTASTGLLGTTFTTMSTAVSVTGATDKSTWDAARIRASADYTQNSGADDAPAQISAIEVTITYTAAPTLAQSSYRVFTNTDGVAPASQTPLSAANTAATINASARFRIRLTLNVSGSSFTSSNAYKLQVAPRVGGSCGGGDETFADVSASSGAIRFNDNSVAVDGATITSDADDPVPAGAAGVYAQTNEEANNFTVASTVAAGDAGLWDFSLDSVNAPGATTYCFAVVSSTGAAINAYTVYPEVTTPSATLDQSSFRVFENVDSGVSGDTPISGVTTASEAKDIKVSDGYSYTVGSNDSGNWRIEKRNAATGALITGFGTSGVVDGDSSSKMAEALVIDATHMYVVGSNDATPFARIEKRLLSTGALESSFGTGGVVSFNTDAPALGVAMDTTHLYVVGGDPASGQPYGFLERRSISDGTVAYSLGGWVEGAQHLTSISDIEIDGSYMYLAVNQFDVFEASYKGYADRRLLSDGSLDYSSLLLAEDIVNTIALDQDHLYLGATNSLAKGLRSTGAAAPGFAPAVNGASDIVVADGYLFLTDAYVADWEVHKLDSTTGAYVTAFGTGGTVTVTAGQYVWGVAIFGSTVLLAGSEGTSPNLDWRIERRSMLDGSLGGAADLVPLAAQDSVPTLDSATDPIRVRMTVDVESAMLGAGQSFKLQFASRAGASCGGGDETFADVASGAGAIRFYDNASLADGSTYNVDGDDPTLAGRTVVGQSYEEANPFVTATSANALQSYIWDVPLAVQFSAAATTYCLRLTHNGGAVFDLYSVYPSFTTFGAGGNQVPNVPASLAQQSVADAAIVTGSWHGSQSVKFTATATDADASDTLSLCVEYKVLGAAFDGSQTCGTGVPYSGSGVVTSVVVSGLADGAQYHWQARVRDSAVAYSSWVSFGANLETDRDFGVDVTGPNAALVKDGPSAGVDSALNDGSLDSLSGNWSAATDASSGVSSYEIAIGTTPGASDVLAWTVGTLNPTTASGLVLRTGQRYFFSVRAIDAAGNVGSVGTSDGQLVAPTLNFGLSSSALSFDALHSGNAFTDTASVVATTSTNAYGGYVLRQSSSGPLQDGANVINAYASDYATPTVWSGPGFGYTSSDTSIQAMGNHFGTGTKFASIPVSNASDIVGDYPTISGTPLANHEVTLTYRVAVGAEQPSGAYATTLQLSVTALY